MKDWGAIFRVMVVLWAVACVYCLSKAEQEVYEPVEEPVEEAVTVEIIPKVEEDLEIYHQEAVAYYPVPLDHEIQAHIIRTCDGYGIDPAVVVSMIATESDFDPETIGDGGESYGLMQIQPKWHSERMERLGVTDLLNPLQNVTVGMDYLAELLEKYSLESALTFYNSGNPGENEYSKKVLLYMEGLKNV